MFLLKMGVSIKPLRPKEMFLCSCAPVRNVSLNFEKSYYNNHKCSVCSCVPAQNESVYQASWAKGDVYVLLLEMCP